MQYGAWLEVNEKKSKRVALEYFVNLLTVYVLPLMHCAPCAEYRFC